MSQDRMSSFAEWPPAVSEAQLETLTIYATTYALSHGLLYLPATTPQPPAPASAIHAPLSIFPSLLPRRLFGHAQRLQKAYNILYARIAMDEVFLDRVMGEIEGVGKVDNFVGTMWRGWKKLRNENALAQPLQLGLFRSDYLLHAPSADTPVSLKQVEFNTISSSFGPLSERAAGLHRYLQASTHYYGTSPDLKAANFPPNNTTAGLAEGLAEAHRAYNVAGSCILFVVQAGERNVFDQRWLEYELLEKYSIPVIRQTFDELAKSAILDPSTQALRVAPPPGLSPAEISTIYFRAGYTPTDFPTAAQWSTRFLLERSRAIKCPSIPLQLAGGKKVQQVLTEPGILEQYLCDKKWGNDVFTQIEVDDIKDSWMGMWGLDDDDGINRARRLASSLVLKPQREGGGNNIYKDDIPAFLDALPSKEREAWIAMELIVPPRGTSNYLVRAGGGPESAIRTEVVSELGIFGWALFGGAAAGKIKEKEFGWLVRTKGKDSNEGGVAAGFSVLDSLVLIDG